MYFKVSHDYRFILYTYIILCNQCDHDYIILFQPANPNPGQKVPGHKVPDLGNIGHKVPGHKVPGHKVPGQKVPKSVT